MGSNPTGSLELVWQSNLPTRRRSKPTHSRSPGISGLVVEYIVAIDVTWVRFPADSSNLNAAGRCVFRSLGSLTVWSRKFCPSHPSWFRFNTGRRRGRYHSWPFGSSTTCPNVKGCPGELCVSISGLVLEYIVAIDVTRGRFPADAFQRALGKCSSESMASALVGYSVVV